MITAEDEKIIVNYMLRYFNADYDKVMKKPYINGVAWYEYYWDNEETKKEFLDWLTNWLIKKKRVSKKASITLTSTIDLYFGLKVYG